MEERQYDLTTLDAKKEEINKQLSVLENKIRVETSHLFGKSAPKSKSEMFITNFERAMVIYDGAMVGYKLYRRFNGVMNFFKKNKRKNI